MPRRSGCARSQLRTTIVDDALDCVGADNPLSYRVPIHSTVGRVLQPPDVLVLLSLFRAEETWTLRSLADRLGVKHSKVQRALARLEQAGLYDAQRRTPIPHASEEFLEHALKYLHPITQGPPARGVPTAWGATPLDQRIAPDGEPPPVWPDPHGDVRGVAVEPLDDALPQLRLTWPEVAELAALADGLRLGDARVREAAWDELRQRLRAAT